MPCRLFFIVVSVVSLIDGSDKSSFAETVLYDGSLGTAPGSQGWVYLTNPLTGSKAVQSLVPGGVQVDSTADENDQAGYFASLHPQLPVFDRAAGFTVEVDLNLLAEAHSTTHRAGLALIVLSTDLLGVEISFWTNELWAQSASPLFHHAEGAARDTTALAQYALSIHGDNYCVSVDDAPLLSGPLRDYSAFGLPYTVPNFLFVGDDTSSARARFQLTRVAVSPLAVRALTGDANGDCSVGAADYAIWAAQFGETGTGLSADFDGNGSVGAGDYTLWAANFGNTCAPAGANVPEPGSLLLAGWSGLAALVAVARRRTTSATGG